MVIAIHHAIIEADQNDILRAIDIIDEVNEEVDGHEQGEKYAGQDAEEN